MNQERLVDKERLMDKEQFEKKKKRKVRMNKTIRAIESYLMNFAPKKKSKVYHNLNILLNIPDDTWFFIGTNNPICMYSPYTKKRRKLFRKSK